MNKNLITALISLTESSWKNQIVSIFSDAIYDFVAYDPEEQQITRPGIEHCDWFILPLLLLNLTI